MNAPDDKPWDFYRPMATVIEYELSRTAAAAAGDRLERRWQKFRYLGA